MRKTIFEITINDIAERLRTTPSTVSRALNDHPSISEATKTRIRNVAAQLNYSPNKLASSLRSGKSNILGVIIPSAEMAFFGSVVHGIETAAAERDYNVLLYQTNEQYEVEKKGVRTFLQTRVDGILASISKETTNLDHYKEIIHRGIPLVLFDRVSDALPVSSVVVDDYAGAFEATGHLIQQGCRRIAHIGGQRHIGIFNQRLKGYAAALKAHNLPVNKDWIVHGDVSIESGNDCMKKLLATRPAPDAVFAVEDFTALGAILALKQEGKTIPDDVAVVGFANEEFGKYITPSLSTVSQQTVTMGYEAANLFFGFMAGKGSMKKPKKLVLQPELVCRESSLKCRK